MHGLPVGVEGFIASMFPTRLSFSVDYSHLFPEGGTFGSLRSEPRMVLLKEQRFELQAALCFLWDFWISLGFAGSGVDFAIYTPSLNELQDRVCVCLGGGEG